jgi:hypothetical protein
MCKLMLLLEIVVDLKDEDADLPESVKLHIW